MRAVVTGAGGFVGANLVRSLLSRGDEPVAVVRPGGDLWRLQELVDDLPVAAVDLRDRDAIQRVVVDRRPDVVFNLAAHGAYSWQRDFDAMLSINVGATDALLEAARKVGARLVHAGSSSEYGYRDHAAGELERVEPNSHYAVTKAAATHLCRLAAEKHMQPAVTLRLYSIYGPWEQPGRLMPVLVRSLREGGWPPLVAPETARDFVWVGDACEAFLRAATTNLVELGAIFNVASGTQTSLRTLVDVARRAFAVDVEPTWGTMARRSWDTSTWVGDPKAAEVTLGWRASTPIGEGLERLADWFDRHPHLLARYGSTLLAP